MRVELTMAAAAACALLPPAAGPAAVLTIRSWMWIMSPVEVLSCFTRRQVSKRNVEGRGKCITQEDARLLKSYWSYFTFAVFYVLLFSKSGEKF